MLTLLSAGYCEPGIEWIGPVLIVLCVLSPLHFQMASNLFNRIGQLGLGVALAGSVVNSALYNGMCAYVESSIDVVFAYPEHVIMVKMLIFVLDDLLSVIIEILEEISFVI